MKKIDWDSLRASFSNLSGHPGLWPRPPMVTLLLLSYLVVILLAAVLIWYPQYNTWLRGQKLEQNLRSDYLAKHRQAIGKAAYLEYLTAIDESFGFLLQQLPSKAEVDALLADITRAGLARGLEFELFQPGKEQLKGFYAELSLVLRVRGNYHDFGLFAMDMATLSRIVTMTDISIKVPRSADSDLLQFNTVIKTYRYLEAREGAGPGKGAV